MEHNNSLSEKESKQLESIMHEIHTSLNSITSILNEITRIDLKSKEEQDEAKEKIIEASHNAESIRMYLDYWQLSGNNNYFENAKKNPVDLWWPFLKPNAYFRRIMKKKNIQYNITKDTERIPTISAFPIIHAIINILLDNATKYSPAGGEINCHFETSRFDLTIIMENEGPYVTEEERNDIFESGIRGKYAERLDIRGRGYGMSFLDDIIYEHGGELEIDSLNEFNINGVPYGKFICKITLPR